MVVLAMLYVLFNSPTPEPPPLPNPDNYKVRVAKKPAPPVSVVAAGSTPVGIWDRLAQCEAGGNWAENSGTIFDGGLQFHPGTWSAYKPAGYPAEAWQATREQQIYVAERVLADQGWKAWPACSRKLGLR